jgi:hypothetical protein
LVLGGIADIALTGIHDSALGVGRDGKSIIGNIIKLNDEAGAILASTKSVQSIVLSIFEGELESAAKCIQLVKYFHNVLDELGISIPTPELYGDNLASIEFLQGRGQPTGVRHMQLRFWAIREHMNTEQVHLNYCPGDQLLADYLTKLAYLDDHEKFTVKILGLPLIGMTDISDPLEPSSSRVHLIDSLEDLE